jgi:hypothetical protein
MNQSLSFVRWHSVSGDQIVAARSFHGSILMQNLPLFCGLWLETRPIPKLVSTAKRLFVPSTKQPAAIYSVRLIHECIQFPLSAARKAGTFDSMN